MNENAIEVALENFERISLDKLETAVLLQRKETKYTCKLDDLPSFLAELNDEFAVLQIAERRLMQYQTKYYDTPDFKTYFLHHGGRLDRFKIRTRMYLDSAISFFEIKRKNNHLHTSKWRIPIEKSMLDSDCELFLNEKIGEKLIDYQPVLDVFYRRFTLVHKAIPVRLTFDYALRYTMEHNSCDFGDLVIIEVKKELKSGITTLEHCMRKNGFVKGSLSKYCLGLVSLQPKLKYNRFKPKFEKIYKPFLNEYTTASDQ